MRQKETILRKRLVPEGLPEKDGWYKTEGPDRWFNKNLNCFLNTSLSVSFKVKVEHWYEEETAHVLSDEELKKEKHDLLNHLSQVFANKIGELESTIAITTLTWAHGRILSEQLKLKTAKQDEQ